MPLGRLRIKPRDHLRSEMGWRGEEFRDARIFSHNNSWKYSETNLPRKFQKHLCWRAHTRRLTKAVFFIPPFTESQIALWWDFVSFFFFFLFACFVFQRAGSTWFSSSWKWGYKAEGISCLIHTSIFFRVAMGGGGGGGPPVLFQEKVFKKIQDYDI